MEIGKSINGRVELKLPLSSEQNRSINIFGQSGQGKTVKTQALVMELVREGFNVVILDIRNTMVPGQVFKPFREEFESMEYRVDAFATPIPTDIFTPIIYPDGVKESPEDLSEQLADILSRVYRLGVRQRACIRIAALRAIKDEAFSTKGFKALEEYLLLLNDKVASGVAEKLSPLFFHNSLRQGDDLIKAGRVNIINLSKYTKNAQRSITELYLAAVWRKAQYVGIGPTYIVVDEFQNLRLTNDSILTEVATEGRKFNLSLILSTQSMSIDLKGDLKRKILQNAYQLYFRPSDVDCSEVAKAIDPAHVSNWILELKKLSVGEFVLCGKYEIESEEYSDPILIYPSNKFVNKEINTSEGR